jgi:hypothetical protein
MAAQVDEDKASTPGGVLAAQSQRLVKKFLASLRTRLGTAGIRRSNRVRAALDKPSAQVAHGAWYQAESGGDRGNRFAALVPSLDSLTQRQRNGMWHEQSSLQ